MEGFFQGVEEDTTQDPQLIEWAKQAGQIVDEARRKELYSMALKRIAEEAYWVPLHTYVTLYAFSSDLDFQPQPDRSEEHTSELQSLMRISYAVFCLKKKKTTTQQTIHFHIDSRKSKITDEHLHDNTPHHVHTKNQ